MLNLDMLSSRNWRPVLKAQAYSCRFAPLPVVELNKGISGSDGEVGAMSVLSACWWTITLLLSGFPEGRGSQQQLGRRPEWFLCGVVPFLPFLPVCMCEYGARLSASSNLRCLCRGLCFFTFLPLPSLLECWWCEGPPDALRPSLLCSLFCLSHFSLVYDGIWLLWKCSDLSEQQGLFLPSLCQEWGPRERNQSQKGHGDRRRNGVSRRLAVGRTLQRTYSLQALFPHKYWNSTSLEPACWDLKDGKAVRACPGVDVLWALPLVSPPSLFPVLFNIPFLLWNLPVLIPLFPTDICWTPAICQVLP